VSLPLLDVEGLTVDYPLPRGRTRRAVDDVSLSIATRQTVGLVGESGSGKSSIARAIVGLAPRTAGTITLHGGASAPPARRIQMIFQDPYSSLDPTKTVGYSVSEPLRVHRSPELTRAVIRQRTADMLESVGIPASAASRHPSRFSGGQRQRIAIARALILKPDLVICDEALSALDLSVQAQIINLLTRFRDRDGVSYLFISHDLSVVEMLCDEVVVLYRGRVAETGPARRLREAPLHPYTRGLVAAIPRVDPGARAKARERRELLRTPVVPAPALDDSCAYRHRCVFAAERCAAERPALRAASEGARVACHRAEDVAAQLDGGAGAPAAIPTGGR